MSRHWTADPRAHLALLLVPFALAAAAVQAHCVDLLSSDGECYLRIARYYAAGDVRHAVFGHWSPLGAWASVPLVAAGVAPRVAMRLWIGIWGALAVVGVWRLAARFELGGWPRAAATGCAALMVAEFSADHRVDLLVAALLLLYLDAAMDERLLSSRWRPLAVGLLGALAYLAKQYALPFFLVHFTLMVVLRAWAEGGGGQSAEAAGSGAGRPWRALRAWVTGLGAFAVAAAPWVGVLSGKYGRLTFGTAGRTTYARYGPATGGRRPGAPVGLRRPPADAYNVWQDATLDATGPDAAAPRRWSREGLARQMRFAWGNLGAIVRHLASADEFRLGLASLVLAPVAAALSWRRRAAALRYVAAAATVIVFCGGYALVFAGDRRFFWFPLLVLVVLAFRLVGVAPRLLRGRRRGLVAAVLVVAATVSFGFHPVRFLAVLWGQPPLGREHRLVAARLAEAGVVGPLASMGPRGWWHGLHTAYYLDAKYAGTPKAAAPAGIADEMREAGAPTLLVWGRGERVEALLVDPRFQLVLVVREERVAGLHSDVWVWRPRPAPAASPGPGGGGPR